MKYIVIPNLCVATLSFKTKEEVVSIIACNKHLVGKPTDTIMTYFYSNISTDNYELIEGPENRHDNPMNLYKALTGDEAVPVPENKYFFTSKMLASSFVMHFADFCQLFDRPKPLHEA